MTVIKNDSPKHIYRGPFTKNQLLPIPFPYADKTNVFVMIDSELASQNTEFEIVDVPSLENPEIAPNSVKLKIDLPKAQKITVFRETPLDQQAAFPQNAKFSSKRIEDSLDKLCMQQQEQEEQLARCIIAPISLETFNGQLPEPASNQALKWSEDGTELENYDIIGRQDAFENDVNTRFEEQSTAFENRITEFEEDTNAQFSEFRAEISENLEAVLDAADRLEVLDETVAVAEQAAAQATAAAVRADEAVVAADQAVDEAESAADQAEDALTEVKEFIQNAEHEISQYYSLPMFTPIWSDHILNDASYLRADTFSWHNGEIYTTAYNLLLNEFNSDKSIEELEGNVTYKRTPSGFKIADIAQHENILTTFTMTGKSWFYVLDTAQQRFKLPRTQYSFTGIRDTVGGDVHAGLPSLSSNSTGAHTHTRGTMDITGTADIGGTSTASCFPIHISATSGAFSVTNSSTKVMQRSESSGSKPAGLTFKASNSWTGSTSSAGGHTHTITDSAGVLGKSNTVQPPATQMYLYFFVGNYARPQSDIDIGELVEIVNERDFTAQVTAGKNELNTTKNNCIKEINSTSVGGRVLKTGDTMTGNLTIEKSANTDIYLDNTSHDYTSTTAPSTATRVGGVFARDKNNKITGSFQSYLDTNGNYITNIYARRSVEGAEKSCAISTYVGPTGNVWTYAPTPATGDNSTKIATTAYCVNMRCTTKATTTSSASTTRPCWIVQNYRNGKSWYRVWSDGWIEQGGAYTTKDTSWGKQTFTLLKSFSNTDYGVFVQCSHTGYSGGACAITAKAAGSFAAAIICVGDPHTSWYACGY